MQWAAMGTHGVPTGYSRGTHGVPTGYPRGTHGVLTGRAGILALRMQWATMGTHGALTGYSRYPRAVLVSYRCGGGEPGGAILLSAPSGTQRALTGYSQVLAGCMGREYPQSTSRLEHPEPSCTHAMRHPRGTREYSRTRWVLVSTHARGAGRSRPRAAGRSGPRRPLLCERSIDYPYPWSDYPYPWSDYPYPWSDDPYPWSDDPYPWSDYPYPWSDDPYL